MKRKEAYKPNRWVILVVAVISLINVVLTLLDTGRSFYLSAFVPLIATTSGMYYYSGFVKWLLIVIGGFAFSLLFLVCFIGSWKEWKWTMLAAVAYLSDTIVMGAFIWASGFEFTWLIDIILHVVVVAFMFTGAFSGRQVAIKGNIEEEEIVELDNSDMIYLKIESLEDEETSQQVVLEKEEN